MAWCGELVAAGGFNGELICYSMRDSGKFLYGERITNRWDGWGVGSAGTLWHDMIKGHMAPIKGGLPASNEAHSLLPTLLHIYTFSIARMDIKLKVPISIINRDVSYSQVGRLIR